MNPETRWIRLREGGTEMLINVEDFDSALHEPIDASSTSGGGSAAPGGSEKEARIAAFEEMVAAHATKLELIEFAQGYGLDIGGIDEPDDVKKDVLIDLIRDALNLG